MPNASKPNISLPAHRNKSLFTFVSTFVALCNNLSCRVEGHGLECTCIDVRKTHLTQHRARTYQTVTGITANARAHPRKKGGRKGALESKKEQKG
ncbi:hypothetical protein TNCT_42241 [Trichonephila clavata]|uniref:Uncharacterized protein n=1 Tax=Trichonephila clavata TaxID=2740835 RepID=A0A8X6IU75_TRICU|nr:hypothetical protein TNCT_42241 [Trichonephila clavata]